MDYSKLSLEEDKEIIIPRALYVTTKATFKNDIAKLENLYSFQDILSVLQNTKERISNAVCELVAKHYNVPVFYRYKL